MPATPIDIPASISPEIHLSLIVAPTHPRQLDPTTFRVKIAGPHGDKANNTKVIITLTMPSMPMPSNTIAARRDIASGTYVGTGRFTMPGEWVAKVTATMSSAPKASWTATQDFPITVSP